MHMKHTYRVLILILVILLYPVSSLVLPQVAYAATPTPTANTTPTPTPLSEEEDRAQIEQLKERLATKVAELRTLVKRAMTGTVKTVSVASATVETDTKDIKIELEDSVGVAQIIRGKRTELTVEDLDEGDPVTVFGTYDATLDLLQAKYIFIESSVSYVRVAGTVTDIDTDNNTITVKTPTGKSHTIDIERTTETTAWSKSEGKTKSGFSQIETGDTVHVVGTPDKTDADRLSAARILDLGKLTLSATPTTTPTPEPEASESGDITPTP